MSSPVTTVVTPAVEATVTITMTAKDARRVYNLLNGEGDIGNARYMVGHIMKALSVAAHEAGA